jgi:hypothetical protein
MDMCQDFRGTDVDFRQFLNGSLIEVLSLSLCKSYVTHVIKIKPYGSKIKVVKLHGE